MPRNLSANSHFVLFSIGRGNAGFLRTGLNQGFILDMGKSEEFSPANFVRRHLAPTLSPYRGKRIAQAVLSHPHLDHVLECGELSSGSSLDPVLLTCPNDRSEEHAVDWSRIQTPGDPETILETYRTLYGTREPPLQSIKYESARLLPGLEYGLYFVSPRTCGQLHPSDDNEYGNSLSIVLYFKHGQTSLLVPGDITPPALELILEDSPEVEKRFTRFDPQETSRHSGWHRETSDQPSLGTLLSEHGLTVLVAPHHGLESCFPERLFDTVADGKPEIVLLSEKRHMSQADGSIDARYQSETGAKGHVVDVEGSLERRRSLSTSGGHHVLVRFSPSGIRVHAYRDPRRLIELMS